MPLKMELVTVYKETTVSDKLEPPIAKYRYTLVVAGNSHDEIVDEILMQTRGGYLLDSDHYKRDEFKVYGGNKTTTLEHANPEMTTERYKADLDTWWQNRKEQKKGSNTGGLT